MSNKNIKLLLVVFVVLVGLLAIRQYTPPRTKETSAYTEKTKAVNTQSVAAIEISNSSGSVQLKKESDTWKVNGKKADATKINSLLSSILPAAAPELIAQTDKRHKELELTDDLATKIKLDNKLTVLTGKSGGSGAYIRFDADPTVYLLKNNPSVTSTASEWYDKTVLAIDKTKVTKITFREGNSITMLAKDGDKWKGGSKNEEIENNKVDAVLSQVSSLTAQSLFDAVKENSYPKQANLTFTIEYDGKLETLEFYKGDSDYLIKRQSDGEQFVVSEYGISSVISAPKDIL